MNRGRVLLVDDHPALLLQGDMSGEQWLRTGIAFFTAMFGFLMIAAAIEAYLFRPLKLTGRLFAGIAGVLLMIPEDGALTLFDNIPTDTIGMLMAFVIAAVTWWQSKNAKACALGH